MIESVRVTPAYDAETVTGVEAVTTLVVTVKVALVAPLGIVRLAGTVAAPVLLLEREMTAAPLGAGPLKVTVPVEVPAPATLLGFSVSEVRVAPEMGVGVTVSVAFCGVAPAREAEILTVVEVVTAMVVTGNVPTVPPAATITLEGTVATDVLLLARETTVPPAGAAVLIVTLPVDGFPPLTLVGFNVRDESVAELVGGGGGVVDVVVPVPPQEFQQSEATSNPNAAAKPGRWREAWPNPPSVRDNRTTLHRTRLQMMPRARKVPRDELGIPGPGGIRTGPAVATAARGVVCTVTVAVAGFVPSSATEEGVITHVVAAGKPLQPNVTV